MVVADSRNPNKVFITQSNKHKSGTVATEKTPMMLNSHHPPVPKHYKRNAHHKRLRTTNQNQGSIQKYIDYNRYGLESTKHVAYMNEPTLVNNNDPIRKPPQSVWIRPPSGKNRMRKQLLQS